MKKESKAELERIAAEIEAFDNSTEEPYLVLAVLPSGEDFRFRLAWGGNSRGELASLIAGLIERKYDLQAATEVVRALRGADARRAWEKLAGVAGRAGHA